MKTLVLETPGSLKWVDVVEPVPMAGQALARVVRCGVCGTDIHAMAGRQPFFSYPRRLGHELCVEVISADGGDLRAGDLCTVEAYYFCGSCPACLAGMTNCCRNLQVLGVHIDGGHAPLITVPLDKLHRSRSLSPDQIALAEPLVIGAHGVERAAPRKGEPTAIIGMGPIGLAAAIFAKAAGANIACIDVQADRISFACDKMELGKPLLPDGDLAAQLQKHFGQLPSLVIDATGSPASMKGTFQLAEHGGRIVFIGLFIGEVSFDDPNFHRRELTLMASRAGLTRTFQDVLRAMETNTVDVMPLITHRVGFAQAAERLPLIHREPGLVKAMIDFD
jgi:threonine dehydrogenase-like Zn-dependent dehydrogenase